ncbi:MAG: metallophosphoesterase [Nitrospirota bacterium]|jgi:predicted MPP superfamily phosphohydrolase
MRLFILSFFLIYAAIHAYVFAKVRAALGLGVRTGIPLALFMLFMVAAPLIVHLAEERGLEAFARGLAWVGYMWLSLVGLTFLVSLGLDVLGLPVKLLRGGWLLPARAALSIAVLCALTVTVVGYFSARDIRTKRVVVETAKLPVPRIRVAQISDVHVGLIVRESRLSLIVKALRAARPDLLVVTGDLVDGQINNLGRLVSLLRDFHPPLGKFAVTGNHEFYAGIGQALDFTRKTGFRVLRGEAVDVQGLITLAGVDDPTAERMGMRRGLPETELLSGLPHDRFVLLLKHRPWVKRSSRGLFDLQLSGHTHRGQIFPFNYVVRTQYPHLAGFFNLKDGSRLYVSPGTGTWGPPVRFLAPPEVTIIDLVRAP